MVVLSTRETRLKGQIRSSRPDPAVTDQDLGSDSLVGDALRSIYRQTVEEELPQEFLDILGKLR